MHGATYWQQQGGKEDGAIVSIEEGTAPMVIANVLSAWLSIPLGTEAEFDGDVMTVATHAFRRMDGLPRGKRPAAWISKEPHVSPWA